MFNKDKEKKGSDEPSIPVELSELYGIANAGEKEFKIKIYELERPRAGGRGQDVKVFVDEVHQEIVDEIYLRDTYGPGRYECSILINGRTVTTRRFPIKGRPYSAGPEWGGPGTPHQHQGGSPLIQEAEKLQAMVMALAGAAQPFVEMYERLKKGNQPSGMKKIDALMEDYAQSSLKRMQGLEKLLEKTYVEKYTEKPRQEKAAPYEPGKEIVLSILNTLKPYLNTILGAGPVDTAVLKQGIKRDPEMKQYINNPEILARLFEAMKADPEVGEEKASIIYQKIGLRYEPPVEAEEADPPGEEEEPEDSNIHEPESNLSQQE